MNPGLSCRNFSLLLTLVLLAGCASFAGSGAAPDTVATGKSAILNPAASASVGALLAYFDTLRKLPPAELARATELARKRYATEKTAVRQMQYALVLAVPGGDAEHAQQLLEPLTRESQQNRELRGLAVLLSVDLAERQRLDDSLQAQTRRADELERQLEALKNVEKQMLQRDVPGLGKP
jgi:hypothetical protein